MKNEQNQEPSLENESLVDEPTLTLGVLLKAARENKGLSVEAIASQLHLRPAIIEEIEADNLKGVGAATYVRGYVKNYARAVQADPFSVQECLDKQLEDDEKPSMQSFSRKTTRQARDGRLMALTYIIVFVLLALMVLWWFQKSSMETTVDYSQPTVEEVAASVESGLPSPIEVLQGSEAEQADVSTAINELDGSVPAAQEVVTETVSEAPKVDATPVVIVSESTPAAADSSTAITAVDTNDSDASTLTLNLTGDCWIKVTDADGNVLVSDLKKSGNQLNLVGAEPFAVTLGAPQVVNIQLNGAAIKLDAQKYPSGKVAKLSLPFAG
ncbi:XRE family transcriptional regulator [Shewanella sairae]|uniref:XRE family transcriptional regulator n=1 Tax=Shewanella sairae TaxID=190310 RepID=A0ABQ4PEV2_9GAMM|nr:RodZ domain-containing protein [Shewanella sairae]MCL1129312.1 DUF4115 domain-containing protein [Shewanella sairae]GIU46102.1 XRE family transcriptional regulator [Shewanella sairae]